jgi:uncharacterized membrane protein YczE
MLRRLEWRRVLGNLFFLVPFGYLVGAWGGIFRGLGVGQLHWALRLALDIGGLVMVATAVSIYQRVNVILHPNDDMTNIMRFKYFHGSAPRAQLVNFAVPLIVIGVVVLFSHRITAFNLGTAFSFFSQGPIIAWADTHVFRHLTHHYNDPVPGDFESVQKGG